VGCGFLKSITNLKEKAESHETKILTFVSSLASCLQSQKLTVLLIRLGIVLLPIVRGHSDNMLFLLGYHRFHKKEYRSQ